MMDRHPATRMISYQLEVTTPARTYTRWYSTPANWSPEEVFDSALRELYEASEIRIVAMSVRSTLWRPSPVPTKTENS